MTHDVLPSIRRHGCYPPPATVPGLFGPLPAPLRRKPRGVIPDGIQPATDLIRLAAVPSIDWLPERPAVSTVYEWHRFGRRGVYLETIRSRGRLYTTAAAVLAFLLRLAEPNPGPGRGAIGVARSTGQPTADVAAIP